MHKKYTNISDNEIFRIKSQVEAKEFLFDIYQDVCYLEGPDDIIFHLYKGDRFGNTTPDKWIIASPSGFVDEYETLQQAIDNVIYRLEYLTYN